MTSWEERYKDVTAWVAANVRELRRERDLTQAELAEGIGLETRSIQMLEAARTPPSMMTLVRLAVALGVDEARLLRPAEAAERNPGRPRRPER